MILVFFQVNSHRFHKSEVGVTDEFDHVNVKSEGFDNRDVDITGVFDCMETLFRFIKN